MKDLEETKKENEDKLTVDAIVELVVKQNVEDVVNMFGLKKERVSMKRLGYENNGREGSDVSCLFSFLFLFVF